VQRSAALRFLQGALATQQEQQQLLLAGLQFELCDGWLVKLCSAPLPSGSCQGIETQH
jgi:hypothetical protein